MDSRLTFRPHLALVTTDGGTKKGRPTGRADVPGQGGRELRQANPSGHILRADGEPPAREAKWLIPCFREKPLGRTQVPVPQTDTGRREEDSKAIERTLAKELGKIAP